MRYNGVDISYLGDTGFRIEQNGFVVYLDPAKLDSDPKKADVVLMTSDRTSLKKQKLSGLLKDDTLLLAGPSVLDEDFCEMAGADFINQRGVEIRGVPGFVSNNITKDMAVGFLITMNGVKLYHPGNTNLIPNVVDLKAEGVDIALLPDIDKAAYLVKEVGPKAVIPLNGHSDKLKKVLGSSVKIL